MFHRRSSEFEPRISAITDHLRGIRRELGRDRRQCWSKCLRYRGGHRRPDRDALRPVLQDIEDRFRAGQRRAVVRPRTSPTRRSGRVPRPGAGLWTGSSEQAEAHPLTTIAVALGVGLLMGSPSAAPAASCPGALRRADDAHGSRLSRWPKCASPEKQTLLSGQVPRRPSPFQDKSIAKRFRSASEQ